MGFPVHGQVAEGGEEGVDVREEVGGEPLDVRLRRAAIAVALLLLLLHLSRPTLRKPAGGASCSARRRRHRHVTPMRAPRREWTRARRGILGSAASAGMSRSCGHPRAITRHFKRPSAAGRFEMLRLTVTKSVLPGSDLRLRCADGEVKPLMNSKQHQNRTKFSAK